MGTYLTTGIVQDIIIEKRQIRYKDITIDIINARLKEEINLDHYDYTEDSDGYYWKIKPKMLEGNLVEFLDTQFQMYEGKKDSHMQKALEEIAKAKTGNEILNLAASNELINFQLVDQIMEHIRVIRSNGFDEHVRIYYNVISYFMDGKIIMECYANIFKYFELNIRLQKDKYPIVDCVKIMITG